MKLLISVFVVMLFCVDLLAQKAVLQKGNSTTKTAVSDSRRDSGRYEIIVFPVALVRLDTYTGQTYYSVLAQGSRKGWVLAKVEGKGLPDESLTAKPKYRMVVQQVSFGKDSEFHYYLLNTETGQTWVSKSAFQWDLRWESFSDG
jgi:hypothetical protein